MITAKGSNGTLHFDGQTVTIERSGFRARLLVGSGSKTIPLSSIAAVQWKKASFIAGFIKLTPSGGSERRSRSGRPVDVAYDENTVTFQAKQQPAFEAIRDAIEQAIAARQERQPTASTPAEASIADELAKLAELKQQGVISEEDFERAKARLLGT